METSDFAELPGIYEPSAIQQLADGRFLVVEDEKEHPLRLLSLGADGSATSVPADLAAPGAAALPKLADLEGLAADDAGFLYAVTSHSRTAAGEAKASRERLVRFRIDGDRVVAPLVVDTLKDALAAAHPLLAAAAQEHAAKSAGALNIEALEWCADGRLLFGLRGPLAGGRALLVALDNPGAVFDAAAAPAVSPWLVRLDLDGDGIRALAWCPALAGYLLIGGPADRAARPFRLWWWSGRHDEAACPARLPGLAGFARAEGLCPARLDGAARLVIVSDDGDRAAGRPAHFLVLDPQRLEIGPASGG